MKKLGEYNGFFLMILVNIVCSQKFILFCYSFYSLKKEMNG